MGYLRLAALALLLAAAGCETRVAHPPAHPATTPTAAPAALAPVAVAALAAPGPELAASIRYELLREARSGAGCAGGASLAASHTFLHLLGPDTLRPALRRLQCPLPAQRRGLVQEELQALSCENEELGYDSSLEVTFNAAGLLSLVVTESSYSGGPYPNNSSTLTTYDLATGRACPPEQWLRPGSEPALRRLLARALQADSIGRALWPDSAPALTGPLPELGLCPQGTFCLLGSLGAPHVAEQARLLLPWAVLRPYVRPGSPLARALAAR